MSQSVRQVVNEVVADVRTQTQIDRLGIRPVKPENLGPVRRKAWFSIVVLYVAGWGVGLYNAIAALLGFRDLDPEHLGPATVFSQSMFLALDVAVLGAGIAALLYFRRVAQPPSPAPPVAGRTRVRTFFVATMATWIGFFLVGQLWHLGVPGHDYPHPATEGVAATVLADVDSMMAGPLEEVILLALVVVALRRSAYSWGTVCTVAVALRVPFHLYYGWGALALAAWALLIVALYRRTGALSAIILEHATWNLTSSPTLPDGLGVLMKVAFLIAGIWIVLSTLQRYTDATKAANPDITAERSATLGRHAG